MQSKKSKVFTCNNSIRIICIFQSLQKIFVVRKVDVVARLSSDFCRFCSRTWMMMRLWQTVFKDYLMMRIGGLDHCIIAIRISFRSSFVDQGTIFISCKSNELWFKLVRDQISFLNIITWGHNGLNSRQIFGRNLLLFFCFLFEKFFTNQMPFTIECKTICKHKIQNWKKKIVNWENQESGLEHSVWKSPKMSHLSCSILTFSTNFLSYLKWPFW